MSRIDARITIKHSQIPTAVENRFENEFMNVKSICAPFLGGHGPRRIL